jgi:outer membrane protein assembly factor BamB
MLVVAATAGLDAQQPDWPQWRGPNRDGAVASFTALPTWPDALTLRWKVPVGDGYATPVLVGDRIYIYAREGENEALTAHDAASGRVVWTTQYAAPFTMNQAAVPHGPGPKSTPTFAGGRLFTLGMSGIVTAVDAATGRQIWQKPAPPVGPLYGTAISPLVDRGLVIVHVGGHDQGALTAFDAATGEVRWSWDGDGPSYSSPLVAELDGIRQVIAMTQENIVGVEAETGTLLWRRPFTTGFTQNIITPIITGRTVIVSGFQRPVSAFRVVSREGRWSTEDAWENADASLYMTNGVLVGNALFGLSQRNSGQYFLIDVTSGRTLWTGMPRQAENAAIVRAGDLLFVLEDDAELIVGRVRPEGFEPLKRYTVAEGATWAQPVVSGRRIFVKDASTLALWTLD